MSSVPYIPAPVILFVLVLYNVRKILLIWLKINTSTLSERNMRHNLLLAYIIFICFTIHDTFILKKYQISYLPYKYFYTPYILEKSQKFTLSIYIIHTLLYPKISLKYFINRFKYRLGGLINILVIFLMSLNSLILIFIRFTWKTLIILLAFHHPLYLKYIKILTYHQLILYLFIFSTCMYVLIFTGAFIFQH